MSIGKKGRVCTITYPNGNYYASSLATYTGQFVETYDITKPNADSAFLRGECLIFDLPELEQGFTDWHTFSLQFSGKYDGVDLPKILINMSYFVNSRGNKQISFRLPNVTTRGESGRTTTLVSGWSYDGGLTDSANKKWCIMLEKVNNVFYLAIGYSTRDSRELHVMGGVIQGTLYFNATTEVDLGFPYGADGNEVSTSKGGQGTMLDTSDPIAIDDIRNISVGKLFRVYKMSQSELNDLSDFLMSDSFLDNVKKLFTDPMDYLISLVAIPSNAFPTEEYPLVIGSILSSITTHKLTNFVADVNCGEISISEYFETFMDYSPFTKVTIYLPFIGYVNLNIDAFQDNRVKVKYRIDALTGTCVAFISNNEGLIATHSGNCAYHIPLRSRDYSQMISGMLNVASNVVSNNPIGVASEIFASGNFKIGGSISSGGYFTGNTGIMTNRKPYLIIERPSISVPANYGKTIGFMSRINAKLGDLKGFTVVEAIHLEHVNAPDEEKRELEALLKQGVIL